ncbi:MAG: hypothetical protein ORN98_02375, partial [Alphaproteobacteria bacterium]|nr:hypothetical protein [Alphaproteobacteria bacterium]
MDILSFDFDKMSPLELELVKKTTQKWREDGLAKMDHRHYYPMANDCQIKDLAKHYENLFGKKDKGVFVEIGAFDGQEVSNTAGLADLGWRGVYVEPVPA